MGATQFKRAELEDQEIISHYFEHHTSRSCERTFANVYLWSRQYPVKWAIIKNALVFKSEDENHVSFAYPAGRCEECTGRDDGIFQSEGQAIPDVQCDTGIFCPVRGVVSGKIPD